nr:10668_t:CDS:2 [Entrophospora candida]
MTEKRTILLLGRTGNGKSTMANVISNTGHFAESEYGVSETRGIQEGIFRVRKENVDFHIVDTIGIGDTRFDEKEVLLKLAEATNAIKNGLNQILFVTSGRFTEEEVRAYNLLRTVFFAEDIGEYTTIVRTKFPSFRKVEKCKNDKEKMIAENDDVGDIIRSCKKLIHVNNLTEEEDPELKSRKECRDILRAHLKFNCGTIYRPRNLDEANERIRNHMTDREKTQKQMDDLNEKIKQSEERAKNSDAEARKREERLRQQYNDSLKNLANQKEQQNESLVKAMAEQMNSKLSTIEKGHNQIVDNLQSRMTYLVNQLEKKDREYKASMNNQLRNQKELYESLRFSSGLHYSLQETKGIYFEAKEIVESRYQYLDEKDFEWQSGEIQPTDEELDLLEEAFNEASWAFDFLIIGEEKDKREKKKNLQNQINSLQNQSNNNNEEKIRDLQRQIDELKNKPSLPNSDTSPSSKDNDSSLLIEICIGLGVFLIVLATGFLIFTKRKKQGV